MQGEAFTSSWSIVCLSPFGPKMDKYVSQKLQDEGFFADTSWRYMCGVHVLSWKGVSYKSILVLSFQGALF